MTNATTKLKASIKNKKLDYNKLLECVKRVEKEVENSESFVKGKGWTISIQMKLDKGSILAVLDCEKEGKEEPKTGTETTPEK